MIALARSWDQGNVVVARSPGTSWSYRPSKEKGWTTHFLLKPRSGLQFRHHQRRRRRDQTVSTGFSFAFAGR